jgi:hypothetical protein
MSDDDRLRDAAFGVEQGRRAVLRGAMRVSIWNEPEHGLRCATRRLIDVGALWVAG